MSGFTGGAFRAGSKAGVWYKPILNQTHRGYAVASIDYRLSGTARFPALVHDAKAAVRWLHALGNPKESRWSSASRPSIRRTVAAASGLW